MTSKKLPRKLKKLPGIAALVLVVVSLSAGALWATRHQATKRPINSQEALPQTTNIPTQAVSGMMGQIDKTAFPELNMPKYVAPGEANQFLSDTDPVFLFDYHNKRYVYPVSIMTYHHIANDVIDGEPVAITYCLLSHTAAIYSRQVAGSIVDFGVLATLYYGNEVMYDKQTNSYWQQLRGNAFHGPYEGHQLTMLGPVSFTTWQQIKQQNVQVLAPANAMSFYSARYTKYSALLQNASLLPKEQPLNQTLPQREVGLGIVVHNQASFIPLTKLTQHYLTNITLGGWQMIAVTDPTTSYPKLFRTYLPAKNVQLTFTYENGQLQDQQTHSTWNMNGVATDGKLKGYELASPSYAQVYWYCWSAFYPSTTVN